ncbi:MAG: 30S ribosome-binding factor RbfA [Candidatus Omnitrophica bacterium]|jgi:ribosome-binding factor A|nr:30S ribosome-binding factor RbfA [Candidatus Omnitrophota bacterium]MDX9753707.1 30S ribosome-binding factor RbfA [bacterium]
MTQKKTYRIAQVNQLLREEIASIILTELQDERLHAIGITEVRASRDLKHAQVFFSTHVRESGSQFEELIQQSAGHIRKLLFHRLHLRHIPELLFRYDESLDQAERIYEMLKTVDTGTDDELAEEETQELNPEEKSDE